MSTQLRCSKCAGLKDTTEFYRRNGVTRGYTYLCKPCLKPFEVRTQEDNWERSIKRKFGVDKACYFKMLADQEGRCALCGDKECQSGKRFAVDHCHTTGSVRGLLCYNCNTGLGKFKDKPDILRKAADYLERNT